MGGADQCIFMTFCDAFQAKSPGGRAGDVDDSKWSYSRLSQETNPSQGSVNKFIPVNAEFCTTRQVRLAPNDSFICGQEFGESNHWMEAINDNGVYVMDSNRILQPFDFAGRTGTLDFSVDAKTTGGHGSWIEVWLTAEPMQSPHTDKPGTHIYPRQGIGFTFDADWCPGGFDQSHNALRQVDVFNNYVDTISTVRSPCFTTKDDMANHFQIKVASDHVEVWASDFGGTNFRRIANVAVAVPFSRGYWSLQHAQYNASKAFACDCGPNQFTYHWHAVSFDGPVLAADRSYQVPDSLVPQCGGINNKCGINLGYEADAVAPATRSNFTLPNVDLRGVAKAYVTYNAWYTCCNPKSLLMTLNGVSQVVADPNPDAGSTSGDVWRNAVVPIPLSQLRTGTNTLSFAVPPGARCNGSCPSIANIDLELVRG